jgi:hypothetical protein
MDRRATPNSRCKKSPIPNGPATATFTFELRQGTSDSDPGTGNDTEGTLLATVPVTANNQLVQLNGFLVPGVYQVCEIPGPGWTSDLGGANQFVLMLNLDNSRVCADFTVVAGQNLTINVANTQPGGASVDDRLLEEPRILARPPRVGTLWCSTIRWRS